MTDDQSPAASAAERVRSAVVDPLTEFLHDEAAGGIALAIATVVALVWANSAFSDEYVSLWDTKLSLGIGAAAVSEDLRHWVNDGLMAIFFFVVGLEIKRELVCGELQDRRAAALPIMAAAGGVAVPALVFTATHLRDRGSRRMGDPGGDRHRVRDRRARAARRPHLRRASSSSC